MFTIIHFRLHSYISLVFWQLPNMKKIVVKVTIACEKCKSLVLTSVAKLEGIKSLNIDAEKGTLTVVGDVDPICIIKSLRKKGRCAELVTVGPEDKKKVCSDAVNKDDKCRRQMIECCSSCSSSSSSWMPAYPAPPVGTIVVYEQPYGCIIS